MFKLTKICEIHGTIQTESEKVTTSQTTVYIFMKYGPMMVGRNGCDFSTVKSKCTHQQHKIKMDDMSPLFPTVKK